MTSCHLNGDDYPRRLAVKKEHAVTDEKGRPLGYTWEQLKKSSLEVRRMAETEAIDLIIDTLEHSSSGLVDE